MVDERYFDKIIAKELGIKVKDLTLEKLSRYIDKMNRKVTSCISTRFYPIGICCTSIAYKINSGLYSFMSHKEELELMQYIKNWHK